ncbi:hypothetical protein QAD02_005937 [Eretmocerus hayati]|uniref:Uncharacterized protein n=1 Tax=Eretmocerus hayati TaxID=131215 RepID=A0ACC2N3L6_9HYME|nr:hypothetical protein QAD02_005937 [Eretmocerus hayati]
MFLPRVIFIILLVGSASCTIMRGQPPVKILTTSAEFPNPSKTTEFLRSSVGLENTTLWFVECDFAPNKAYRIRECRFLIGTSSFDNKTHWDSCGFQLNHSQNPVHVDSTLRSYRLGLNRYLLSWLDFDFGDTSIETDQNKITEVSKAHLKFVTIEIVKKHNEEIGCKAEDFETVITYNEGEEYQLWRTLTINLYEDSFDVIYMMTGRNSHINYARERFDMKGNRLMGPIVSDQYFSEESARTVVPKWISEQASNGFYALYSQERLRLATSSGGYVIRDLMKNENLDKLRAWSTSNGLFSYCISSKPSWVTWNCKQATLEASPNSESRSFHARFRHSPETQMMYNLPGGGLLLMTSYREKRIKSNEAFSSFYLTWFDSRGRGYRPVKFAEIDTSSPMLLGHFFEDDDGYFCFAMLHKWGDNRFLVKCYDEKVLTQN